MGVVITIGLVLFAIVVMARAFARGKEQWKGHNRCEFCRAHLLRSKDGMAFADVCSKCGRTQPWASEPKKAKLPVPPKSKPSAPQPYVPASFRPGFHADPPAN